MSACGRSVLRSAYKFRAIARMNVGDAESALADYNKAIELNPDDADVYAARGQFLCLAKAVRSGHPGL